MNQPPVFRIRVTFSKLNALKYTGSLDMHRIWERSFRRAGLPLAYSQGFHPQPRINQALPLPLGMTSRNDLVEFWLEQAMDVEEIAKILRQSVPPGLEITTIESIDVRAPSLPLQVISAQYHAVPIGSALPDTLSGRVASLLENSQLLRERRGKFYDLRPLIEQLALESSAKSASHLFMQLSAREGATGRPEEVLAALECDPLEFRVERVRLILSPSNI